MPPIRKKIEPYWKSPDGHHVLYCADCLDVLPTLGRVDLVLTDPPYGIAYQSNMRVKSSKFAVLTGDDTDVRLRAYVKFPNAMKDNTAAVVFTSFKNYATDYMLLEEMFDIKNTLVWDKGGGGIGDLVHSLLTDYELALVCHKGQCPIRGKRDGSVWNVGKVNPNDMDHATEKPVELKQKIAEKWSDVGNTVLDPFTGSGTTGVACIRTGRKFIGIEIEKAYCDISVKRMTEEWERMERLRVAEEKSKARLKSSLFEE